MTDNLATENAVDGCGGQADETAIERCKAHDPPPASAGRPSDAIQCVTSTENADSEVRPDSDVLKRLADIEAKLDDAVSRANVEQDRAAARERVIDHLHGELERLRSNDRGGQLRPVVTDLRRLRAELLRQARTLSGGLSQDAASALLESFALDVELALERCGVTVISIEPGEQFSGERHQAVKAEAAADASLDGTVAAVVEDGYVEVSSGKVVAPAKVVVNRFSERQEGNTDG